MLPPGWMIELAIKATLLAAMAFLAAPLLRRASAATRHRLWLALFASLAALPVLTHVAPRWGVEALQPAARVEAVARTVITVTAEREWAPAWPNAWIMLWAMGCLVGLARMPAGQWRTRALARRASPWLERDAWLSAEIDVPVVCGVWGPRVVLPEEAFVWPAERVDLVLRHEHAHIARRDPVSRLLATVVSALYWPLAPVWWAARRLDIEAEMACDDAVLRAGPRASDYADHLLAIVRSVQGRNQIPEGGLPMIRITDLEQRLRAMLCLNPNRTPVSGAVTAALLVASLAVLLPLSAARLPGAADGAGIQGVVKDASGALVPRARVFLLFPDRERKELVVTSEAGEFALTPLPDGEYTVTVQKPGFAALKLEGVKVRAGQSEKLELVLKTGTVQETVNVIGDAPMKNVAAPDGSAPKRLRIGGNVQATKLVHKPNMAYPPECKADGVEGSVFLRAVIGLDGAIVNLEQINQMVDKRLVEAAMAAVRQWKYEPTLLNGKPVEVQTEIVVNFELRK
jgi:TonB family protein